MKSTGMVRQVDELGRVVIPKELRTVLGIEIKDAMAFFEDGEAIVLMKYEPGCVFCGSMERVGNYKGKALCVTCQTELKAMTSKSENE